MTDEDKITESLQLIGQVLKSLVRDNKSLELDVKRAWDWIEGKSTGEALEEIEK